MALKYRLNTLGWYNFERLAQTLLKKIIGPGVTSFGGSRDDGRDATFTGSASYPNPDTQWSGYWIFQVKFLDFEEFTPKEARVRLLNEIKKEFQKILSRNRKKPNNYILITNITLTSKNRSDLEAIVQNYGFSFNFASIDGNEICEFLDIHVDLRQSHPQLLGLADLRSIINADVYTRSKLYFDDWSPQIGKFVETQAYVKTMQILKDHNFAVIDGPPEVGKSMIAATCAFIYSSLGFQINVVREPTDFLRIRGSDYSGSQLFIADDAVGSLSYDPGLTERWSQEFSKILRSLDKDHKLIWTARSYILKEAIQKSRLDDNVNSFPGIHEILVEVSDLSIIEKAEILYKHAKGGGLSDFEKEAIKKTAERIVQNKNFTPERIRQLINDYIPSCRKESSPLELKGINDFLKNPGKHWEKAFNQLHASEKTLLLSMLDFEQFAKISELKSAYNDRNSSATEESLSFEDCLFRLDHSFLKVESYQYYGKCVLFQHPSLRDLLLAKIQSEDKILIKHIKMAGPVAISEIVRGFGKNYANKENINHLIILKTDEQLEELLKRIDNFSNFRSRENEWSSLLVERDT